MSATRTRGQTRIRRPSSAGEYSDPLVGRYASREMLQVWSAANRYACWRRIWLALAESQAELGLPIRPLQLRQMRAALDDIDFARAARYEKQTRHDVMAHIHAFGDAAPAARGVIHLGATSMDVVDNADLILMREALAIVLGRVVAACARLSAFCLEHAELPTLGFTHLQPAQLTTVGKRAALWLSDLLMDVQALERALLGLCCRGLRGATGTQASFLALLGSPARVAQLERRFAKKLGFDACYPVCGQTYSRKVDVEVVGVLAALATSVHKISNDIRVLAMLKEIEEPFEKSQVGSSAMPYKRNPALCERATGIARYLISLNASPLMTMAAQFLERTLDDSSNKRLVLPAAFLAADAIAALLYHIVNGLVVYPATIASRVAGELPFIASEEILMAAVAAGGDRQALHERIRRHALDAAEQVKRFGRANDLVPRLQRDPAFESVNLSNLLSAERYVGLAPQQTRRFVREVATPLLRRLKSRALPPAPLSV